MRNYVGIYCQAAQLERNCVFSCKIGTIWTKLALISVVSFFTVTYTTNKTKTRFHAQLCGYLTSSCPIVTKLSIFVSN